MTHLEGAEGRQQLHGVPLAELRVIQGLEHQRRGQAHGRLWGVLEG
jgi:hypothetical protein